MIKIELVDDHKMIRQGLRHLLETQNDMTVVTEADNGRDAVRMAAETEPDVVVMDLNLPELNGIEATRQIRSALADVAIVCLSANASERAILDMLQAGASAFVVKESAFEELAVAIRTVSNGRTYLSPSIAGILVSDVLRHRGGGGGAGTVRGRLSPREREILQMIAEGRTTKQIALRLMVSQKTVETHRRNLMQKIKVDSVAELTKFAVREGLTTL